MLGFIAARAATGAVSAATKNGTKPEDVKPTPCAPLAVAAVVVLLAVVVIAAMANGGQVTSLITPLAILMGLILLGGMFWAGTSGTDAARGKLMGLQLPDTSPRAQQEHTAQLRERAAQLSTQVVSADPGSVTGLSVQERPRPAPPAPPRRKFVSLNQILQDHEDTERLLRVAAILVDECPTCTAGPGHFCTFHPGQVVHVLDRERGITVHGSRIGSSVKKHRAKLEDVKAQFDGTIPDDVLRHAL